MANFIDIKVTGDRETQMALNSLSRAMGNKIVIAALEVAGKPVLASARSKAPTLTTALKKSLHIEPVKTRKKIGIRIATGRRDELPIWADDPYYYPMAVEVGTANMPAHPYMRPALDENRQRCIDIAAYEIRKGVEAAVIKRQARQAKQEAARG